MPPRERILAAARDLFHRNGIRAVGVDAIAETARSNKMTLYRHFASKDVLVAEYLRRLAEEAEASWEEIAKAHPGDPEGQLQTWLRHVEDLVANCGDRGCAIANAAIELPDKSHPARRVIEEHKTRQRERLVALCREAGFSEPEHLADQVFLLFEGARVSIESVGRSGPASRLIGVLRSLFGEHARQSR